MNRVNEVSKMLVKNKLSRLTALLKGHDIMIKSTRKDCIIYQLDDKNVCHWIFKTALYIEKRYIPRSHRSALAKFRCGVAPIKLETGR